MTKLEQTVLDTIPCRNCLCLAMCKFKVKNGIGMLYIRCSIFEQWWDNLRSECKAYHMAASKVHDFFDNLSN